MRIEGAGRKPFNKKLDKSVLEWIHERCSKGLRVSRKLIMKKAIIMYDDMVKEGESNEQFKASTGWLRGFMKRYGFSLRRKTSVVSFVLHVRRIAMKHPYDAADTAAIDETPFGQI